MRRFGFEPKNVEGLNLDVRLGYTTSAFCFLARRRGGDSNSRKVQLHRFSRAAS